MPNGYGEKNIGCAYTNTTNVIWNGKNQKVLIHSVGLQGDPIYLYLYVLGMERLTHMILDSVRQGK